MCWGIGTCRRVVRRTAKFNYTSDFLQKAVRDMMLKGMTLRKASAKSLEYSDARLQCSFPFARICNVVIEKTL